jgi:hypothetical protein
LNTITIVTKSTLAKKIRDTSKKAISTQKFSKDYHIEKGIIYHGTQIYIPDDKHLRVEILQENHDHTYSGHLGVDKTYNLILKDYYWPGLQKNVMEFIKTCELCQRNKPSNKKPQGLLQPLPILE